MSKSLSSQPEVDSEQTSAHKHRFFRKLATTVSGVVGSPVAFSVALLLILSWAITGPFFHFSNTWQLVINTSTTILTFLIVFLIQNTQNRDARALHLKLDELIRASKSARDSLVNVEEEDDTELVRLKEEFKNFRDHSLNRIQTLEKIHSHSSGTEVLKNKE